jgi:vacuolar-type H+-ATPase subunit I/STV1
MVLLSRLLGRSKAVANKVYSARKDDLECDQSDVSAPKKQVAEDDSIVAAFENEIRKFIRRDELPVERMSSQAPEAGALAADRLRAQMCSTSNDAIERVDRVISELHEVRHMLCRERERLEREINSYANLSHAAQNAVRAIAESLAKLKKTPNNFERPAAE